MLGKNPKKSSQFDLFRSSLNSIINRSHELVVLADQIDWDSMEKELEPYFSHEGRPSIPARKIVGLLILKRMFNQSDESVVDRWIENPYWQYFTGEQYFQKKKPLDPSEFVHFRKRLGEDGFEKVLSYSVLLFKGAEVEEEVQVDTTVQEKNITYPTDSKLSKKIIDNCRKIAAKENIDLRQSYIRVVRQLMRQQYNSGHPRRAKKARKARKKLKTIAGRMVRELHRKLPAESIERYLKDLKVYDRVLKQNRYDKDKIYSLHELDVSCIAKGKAHKKYEFGSKASIVRGSKSGVITGAKNFTGNPHDSKTLDLTLAQSIRVRELAGGIKAKRALTDRGFRGVKNVQGIKIEIPSNGKGNSNYQKYKERKKFRSRAAIEPTIGHLKKDHRMMTNYLKGVLGDQNNLLLAAIGFNFKKKLNEIKREILLILNEIAFRQILSKNKRLIRGF